MPRHRKILITGADGFIGSHLTEHMLRQGYDVRAFALYNSFNTLGWLDHIPADARREIEIFRGDIRDPHGVRKAMDGCTAVLHLAALIAIPYSYHSPQTYVETNITGTLNVLQAARDLDVHVVHTSTSEVYGTAQFVPITEEHPLQAQSPYAATKVAADQLALSYYRSFGTPVSVLRPFNTYGPRQSFRAVIPTIIGQIVSKAPRIKLGSLHPTRDFSFVEDTARAFEAVLLSDAAIGQVCNCGSGFEISIGDVVKCIVDSMQADVEIVCDDQRLRPSKSEVERLWAGTERLRALSDWTPSYGGLEGFCRGLAKTIEWFQHNKHLDTAKMQEYTL